MPLQRRPASFRAVLLAPVVVGRVAFKGEVQVNSRSRRRVPFFERGAVIDIDRMAVVAGRSVFQAVGSRPVNRAASLGERGVLYSHAAAGRRRIAADGPALHGKPVPYIHAAAFHLPSEYIAADGTALHGELAAAGAYFIAIEGAYVVFDRRAVFEYQRSVGLHPDKGSCVALGILGVA